MKHPIEDPLIWTLKKGRPIMLITQLGMGMVTRLIDCIEQHVSKKLVIFNGMTLFSGDELGVEKALADENNIVVFDEMQLATNKIFNSLTRYIDTAKAQVVICTRSDAQLDPAIKVRMSVFNTIA